MKIEVFDQTTGPKGPAFVTYQKHEMVLVGFSSSTFDVYCNI